MAPWMKKKKKEKKKKKKKKKKIDLETQFSKLRKKKRFWKIIKIKYS